MHVNMRGIPTHVSDAELVAMWESFGRRSMKTATALHIAKAAILARLHALGYDTSRKALRKYQERKEVYKAEPKPEERIIPGARLVRGRCSVRVDSD